MANIIRITIRVLFFFETPQIQKKKNYFLIFISVYHLILSSIFIYWTYILIECFKNWGSIIQKKRTLYNTTEPESPFKTKGQINRVSRGYVVQLRKERERKRKQAKEKGKRGE